jgi:hypothetical protein
MLESGQRVSKIARALAVVVVVVGLWVGVHPTSYSACVPCFNCAFWIPSCHTMRGLCVCDVSLCVWCVGGTLVDSALDQLSSLSQPHSRPCVLFLPAHSTCQTVGAWVGHHHLANTPSRARLWVACSRSVPLWAAHRLWVCAHRLSSFIWHTLFIPQSHLVTHC